LAGGRIPASGQISNSPSRTSSPEQSKILYVNRVGNDGWLQTRKDNSLTLLSLAKYTKLQRIESKDHRSYFKVLDGPSKGQTVSLADANVTTYLGPKAPVQTPVKIVVTYGAYTEGWISEARGGQKLDQQMATLEVSDLKVQVTMNTNWNQGFTPLPAGTYSILVPDGPHNSNMTRFYRSAAPGLEFDQVWFPIKYGDNSRFIHVGNVSDGCTTVLDLENWSKIYEALISHRSPDGTSVGVLEVKGTPQRAK